MRKIKEKIIQIEIAVGNEKKDIILSALTNKGRIFWKKASEPKKWYTQELPVELK